MERRKRTREKSSSSRVSTRRGGHSADPGKSGLADHLNEAQGFYASPQMHGEAEVCHACDKSLGQDSRVLFVEEELRRIFCSEGCISDYFSPEIEKLEKKFFNGVTPSDFSGEERESLAHLRWITLQEPDEVWCERASSGDLMYTLISEFHPGDRKMWCVCICLCLRGEPSFLFLAFPTRNHALVKAFRKGEKLDWSQRAQFSQSAQQTQVSDGLADVWKENETIRAQLRKDRRPDDISIDEFELYQGHLDVTLQNPDEVWSVVLFEEDGRHLYHFIKYFPRESPGIWYLVLAMETEDGEQIEILEAFPTRDGSLVQRYRTGTQEVGNGDASEYRVIH